ncbi:PREDICTED: uncharacterized protein LOC109170641 [Ipomoea nil]|uniref:uncharacterized protein LOC109170641 n=1 Tax=Ipomoea nil TaxID=35883 RepID=UPI000900A83C|nr:PREDICTED: uncharacterized protein LOC109170641 [Ipomoea nil]
MANQTLLLSRRIIPQPTITLSSPRSQVPDESIIREQVLSTHNYDGRKFNTSFILSIVENILSVKMGIGEEAGVEKLNQVEELINYEELPSHIITDNFHLRQPMDIQDAACNDLAFSSISKVCFYVPQSVTVIASDPPSVLEVMLRHFRNFSKMTFIGCWIWRSRPRS